MLSKLILMVDKIFLKYRIPCSLTHYPFPTLWWDHFRSMLLDKCVNHCQEMVEQNTKQFYRPSFHFSSRSEKVAYFQSLRKLDNYIVIMMLPKHLLILPILLFLFLSSEPDTIAWRTKLTRLEKLLEIMNQL